MKLSSGGRWYTPKCTTPGITARGHRIKIRVNYQLYINHIVVTGQSCSSHMVVILQSLSFQEKSHIHFFYYWVILDCNSFFFIKFESFWIAIAHGVTLVLPYICAWIKIIRIAITVTSCEVNELVPCFCVRIHFLTDLAAFWRINLSAVLGPDFVSQHSRLPGFSIYTLSEL